MEIINFDCTDADASDTPVVHHWLLPSSIRCVICGPSGCGKTNLIMNLIMRPNYLNYDRLYVYTKSLQQPKYQFLQKWGAELNATAARPVVSFYSTDDDVISIENLKPNERSVMVFDDVMLEKQTPIERYFSQGRHGNADCFYLCQSYFRIPKQCIRDNANMIIIFNQDNKNLRAIHDTFVGGDMDFNEFRKFFARCVDKKYGFAVIDLTSEPDKGKYRSQFDKCYTPCMYLVQDNAR
jgi:energy-coupling factor transporter ATP-binding protein EcfA2